MTLLVSAYEAAGALHLYLALTDHYAMHKT